MTSETMGCEAASIAVLLGCALRQSALTEFTDGRCSGAFTLEATVAAPRTS